MGNYNDALLEQLADQGDGFYAYVNDLDEARTLFRDELTSTLQSVALDAKAQVEFDPDRRRRLSARRLREPRRRRRGLHRPGVDAGAIGAGHAVTALYALRLRDDARRRATGSPRSAFAGPTRTTAGPASSPATCRPATCRARSSGPIRTSASTRSWPRPPRCCATARSPAGIDLDDILRVADEEAGDLPATDEVHDFLDLLDAASRLDG